MKVKDLIKLLQGFDQEASIYVDTYEYWEDYDYEENDVSQYVPRVMQPDVIERCDCLMIVGDYHKELEDERL